MPSIPRPTHASWRLFAIYVAVTVLPVVALGLLGASGFRSEAQGRVVFSDDGSGFGGPKEPDAIIAAHGTPVARLTRLNADANDHGRVGTATVEVYLPLRAAPGARTPQR